MAWVAGFIVTALGVAGYLHGESLDYPRLVRDEAVAAYQRRFPHTDSHDTARIAPIVDGRWQ
jgi:hypothetical protein